MHLKTTECLMTFGRFISSRGTLRIIYSDNVITFKNDEKDLKQNKKFLKGREP